MPSWTVEKAFLGRLEIVSGLPGWHLGSFSVTLGRPTFPWTFYWQLEPQLGSQNGAKMAKTSIQKSIFWVPKSKQVGTKMGSGAPWVASRVVFSVTTFPPTFYWQLEPQLGSQNGAKMAKKSIPKSIIFVDASWDRFLDGFCCILGPKMEPRWCQNEIKNQC